MRKWYSRWLQFLSMLETLCFSELFSFQRALEIGRTFHAASHTVVSVPPNVWIPGKT